jgi:predicted ATPase
MSAPWEALFTNDEERRHTYADSVAEYERLLPAYRSHGYEIVHLPQIGVPERVAFVLDTIAARRAATG